MRLTLRSMMAYLDGNLQPDDEADIKKKIGDSEFATNLLNRMRDVVQRSRLAAPGLASDGKQLDPNTVAEYLDNAMPDDRVPDFEKLCLDSDVQLAEVVSCHQILTLVLGEPAEVTVGARDRMYALPQLAETEPEPQPEPKPEPERAKKTAPAPAAPTSATPAARAAAETDDGKAHKRAGVVRPKPAVPDYLRESTRKRRMIAIGSGAVALCLIVALVLMNPFKREDAPPVASTDNPPAATAPPSGTTQPQAPAAVAPASAVAPVGEPALPPGFTSPEPAGAVETSPGAMPSAVPAVPTPGVTPGAIPGTPAVAGPAGTTPAVSTPAGRPAVPPTPTVAGPQAGPPTGPVATAVPAPGMPGVTPAAPAAVPGAVVGPPMTPATPGATVPAVLPTVPPTPPGVPGAATPDAAASPAAGATTRAGRFMSEGKVLLEYETASNSWKRVAPKGVLTPNVPLVALPTYQCEITLASGITLQLHGGTQIAVLPKDAQSDVAGLKIDFGRVLIMPLAEAGAKLQLDLGGRPGVVTFADADTIVAIEVRPVHIPGSSPESVRPMIVSDLYVKSGQIVWTEGTQGIAVPANSRLLLQGQATQGPASVSSLPSWCAGEKVDFLDQKASTLIAQAIEPPNPPQPQRPADLSLMEMADHRLVEVRRLACRCLALLGSFNPLVKALDDESLKLEWDNFYLPKLLDGVARGPQQAADIRQAMERQYGADAATLYRMLWGYTPQDLEGGQAAELVENLDHASLALRRLAYWNLKQITGSGLNYKPEDLEAKRARAVQQWHEDLMSGKIRFKEGAAGAGQP